MPLFRPTSHIPRNVITRTPRSRLAALTPPSRQCITIRRTVSSTPSPNTSSGSSSSSSKMSVSTQAEAEIKRNPHPDFKAVEASRPDWDRSQGFNYKKTADPGWAFGDGANSLEPPGAAARRELKHVAIDPYEAGRPAALNYKLLISAIVPRPIGFVSTRSGGDDNGDGDDDGTTLNLAPFSYFNMVNHDPPLFVLGIASPLAKAKAKDTLRNLAATGECVVSVVSEHFVEAANAASVDAPPGVSEWAVSGLTPRFDCADVPRVPRVAEAVFSAECRLESPPREFVSRSGSGAKTGCLVVLEATRFWVREDAVDDARSTVAPEVLRPIARLGGITYARVTEALELPRPVFEKDVGGLEGYERLKEKSREKQAGSSAQG